MATLVLTVIGNDRSGLVDALAGPIAEHGGNWNRSHMARLAGQFAGIVVISAPDDAVDALTASFESLNAQGLLDVRVAIAAADVSGDEMASASTASASTASASMASASTASDGTGATDESSSMRLQLVGQDRPGIIREIARALASHDVSIEELQTATVSAPMSGELLFEATAQLRLPAGVHLADLRQALEAIANELMVDLDFESA
jgi:glycine cleavage system regulatory protein